MELSHWLNTHIHAMGDRNGIIYKERTYTYREIFRKTGRYLQIFEKRIDPGDVVAILSDYSVDSIALFLALIENRNIIVPITSRVDKEIEFRVQEAYTDYILSFYDDKLVINAVNDSSEKVEKHLLLLKIAARKHAGVILFSSGSTGRPKAMVHDLDQLLKSYQGKPVNDSRIIVFLMFDHIGGLNTLLNAFVMGSTIAIPENRDAAYICSLLEKYKINILPSSPTFLNLIMMGEIYKDYDLSSLRLITYGTETMPESLLEKIVRIFPDVKLLQTFGTSETGIARTSSKSSNSTFMKMKGGHHEYKVVSNELWLRSGTQILGYLNASMDSFTEDGWFKTGDLVEQTDDGYIRIIGRVKEVINVGGEKVLPAEVESILLDMNEIVDCMVYGISNSITGMAVAADVVLKDGVRTDNFKRDVRKFCRDKLDKYKIPAKIKIVGKTNFGERFKKMRNR